jgi:hypothetical protein
MESLYIIKNFKKYINDRVEFFYQTKPGNQLGSAFFDENIFSIFGDFQREGQRILNEVQDDLNIHDHNMLALELQAISEEALASLKQSLEDSDSCK